jgi:membrane-bound serine protease (ClpP class)
VLSALVVFLGPAAAAQEPAGAGVTHVLIEGPLDKGTQALLHRAIASAAKGGDRLVVELDTPGGEVELMWQMSLSLLEASSRGVVPVAWVNDDALSAGALIAMACEVVYMRSQGSIGSALPVRIGPGGLMPVAEDAAVREKLLSKYRKEFRYIAEERGRPVAIAESMVDPEVEVVEIQVDGARRLLTMVEYDDLRRRGEQARFVRTVVARGELFNGSGREALELGLSDGVAETLDEVIGKLGVGAVEPTFVLRTRSEDLVGLLSMWSPLLLILGFILAYLEIKVPGFGVPGILSIACFLTVLFGRYLTGLADIPHIILLLVGAGLLAVELFLVPGTLWAGIAGVLCVLVGLIWSFAGSGSGFAYPLDREIVLGETFRVMGSGLIALVAIWTLSRFLPKTPFFSRLVLQAGGGAATSGAMPESGGAHGEVAHVGARGRALTALRPVGKVVLDADESIDFEARANGLPIELDSRVRVVEVARDGRLLVEVDGEPYA